MRRHAIEPDDTPEQGVEIKGFGLGVKAFGRYAVLAILLVALAAVIVGSVWLHDIHSQETIVRILAAEDKNAEKLSELIYVISLSPKQREELKIEMPDSLRQKLLRR